MSAAPLNPAQKNPAFQPGHTAKSLVVKPAQNLAWNRNPLWSGGGTVRKITPLLQAPARIDVGRFSLNRAGEAATQPGSVRPAGGRR